LRHLQAKETARRFVPLRLSLPGKEGDAHDCLDLNAFPTFVVVAQAGKPNFLAPVGQG
jgi:hypothetical protein